MAAPQTTITKLRPGMVDFGNQQAASFSRQVTSITIVTKKRWSQPKRCHQNHAESSRWYSFTFLLLVNVLTANKKFCWLCQAFSPTGSRISLGSLSKLHRHGEASIELDSATSPVDFSAVSLSSSGTGVLSQSIHLTLSEIKLFAGKNDVAFDSHDESILKDIHQQQNVDAKTMTSELPPEQPMKSTTIPYQWLHTERTHKPLAIQTKEPILEDTTVDWIRDQADSIWNDESKSVKSRFTFQRKGNYEVHLSDLIQQGSNQNARREIHQALQQRIYPLVREAFGCSLGDDPSSLQFCVYDAIVIRYNATEAALFGNTKGGSVQFEENMGAGQPLHRDLGLVSVNVMLNSPYEFEGGGTFMENQLQDLLIESSTPKEEDQKSLQVPLPLKPMGGPGHALLHHSSDRHAGASTRRGVRDILVFFLTASKSDLSLDESQYPPTPLLEQAARLKSTARPQCEECLVRSNQDDDDSSNAYFWQPLASAVCRSRYQYLAVQAIPTDGEAWQYLGMALWDIHQSLGIMIQSQMPNDQESRHELVKDLDAVVEQQQRLLEQALSALETAKEFTPCDARVYHNLAWILEQTPVGNHPLESNIHEQIQSHYSHAMELHQAFRQAGCDVGIDYDSTILNYGLYLANKDLFSESVAVLECIQPSARQIQQQMEEELQQEQKLQQRLGLIQDAQRLLSFCQRQISK